MAIRLNKYIADSGIASRRKAEDLILQGRVYVNDKLIMDLAYKVDEEKDEITLDGEKIAPRRHLYFLLNKPKGYVTTTNDEKKRRTVVELINTREKIFPVGRLDYNTTGVLILTNDGDFSNLLTHPKNKVPRVYMTQLDRELVEEDAAKLMKGIFLNGERGVFTAIKFPKKNSRRIVEVTGVEGRNHFVKNMFQALGYTVQTLDRVDYAGFVNDVPPGHYRTISPEEIRRVIDKYGR